MTAEKIQCLLAIDTKLRELTLNINKVRMANMGRTVSRTQMIVLLKEQGINTNSNMLQAGLLKLFPRKRWPDGQVTFTFPTKNIYANFVYNVLSSYRTLNKKYRKCG